MYDLKNRLCSIVWISKAMYLGRGRQFRALGLWTAFDFTCIHGYLFVYNHSNCKNNTILYIYMCYSIKFKDICVQNYTINVDLLHQIIEQVLLSRSLFVYML